MGQKGARLHKEPGATRGTKEVVNLVPHISRDKSSGEWFDAISYLFCVSWHSVGPNTGKQRLSYLFSHTLSYDFPTPKASDQKTETIFAITVICSPRIPIISNSRGAPAPKGELGKQSLWSQSPKTLLVRSTVSSILCNAQSHPTPHHLDISNRQLVQGFPKL